jgi:hypothetical protein
MTTDQINETFSCLEQAEPAMWKMVYPRIYPHNVVQGGRYYPSTDPAHFFLMAAWLMNRSIATHGDRLHDGSRPIKVDRWSRLANREGHFFRDPSLLDSIAHELGRHLKLSRIGTIKLPFPAMVFMLPRGTLSHPTDGEIRFVAYARASKMDEYHSPLGPVVLWTEYDTMCFTAVTETGSVLTWSMSANALPVVNLGDMDKFFDRLQAQSTKLRSIDPGHSVEQTEDDYTLQKAVMHYIFGALLIMVDRPDLISPGQLRKRVQRRGGTSQEWWSPRILGENYRVRRPHVDHGGTHISPRFHWVRGFWRNQAYGPELSLRKRQWIEPFTRGLSGAQSQVAAD